MSDVQYPTLFLNACMHTPTCWHNFKLLQLWQSPVAEGFYNGIVCLLFDKDGKDLRWRLISQWYHGTKIFRINGDYYDLQMMYSHPAPCDLCHYSEWCTCSSGCAGDKIALQFRTATLYPYAYNLQADEILNMIKLSGILTQSFIELVAVIVGVFFFF